MCAERLSKVLSNDQFMLLEKELYWGDQATGRNSGVLHSGIYYETNSLKHRHCIKGLSLWNDLTAKYNLESRTCGKFVLAKKSESEKASNLFAQAHCNEIPGVRWMTNEEIKDLQKLFDCDNGFFVPTTGILNVADAVKKISDHLQKLDFMLVRSSKVQEVTKNQNTFELKTANGDISCDILINLAGAGAVGIREQLGLFDVRNYFVKGHYVKLNKPYYSDSLIYPLPDEGLKGLGVHTSFDFDGSVRFGPDTLEVNEYEYSYSPSNFEKLVDGVLKSFKGLKREDLQMDFTGIRPKILVDGKLYTDFWLKHSHRPDLKNYIELLGIESPGLTSAPSLADTITEITLKMLQK